MPRKLPSLPEQAIPPDKRKKVPPPFESMLPSGILQKWRMPDPLELVSFDGVIPDPITGAVIQLLKNEKSYTSEDDPMRFRHEANNIKGMYGLGAAMAVDPVWDIEIEYGDGNVLGRREIGYQDVCSLYHLFRFSSRNPAFPPARADIVERATDAALDRGDVQQDAG